MRSHLRQIFISVQLARALLNSPQNTSAFYLFLSSSKIFQSSPLLSAWALTKQRNREGYQYVCLYWNNKCKCKSKSFILTFIHRWRRRRKHRGEIGEEKNIEHLSVRVMRLPITRESGWTFSDDTVTAFIHLIFENLQVPQKLAERH